MRIHAVHFHIGYSAFPGQLQATENASQKTVQPVVFVYTADRNRVHLDIFKTLDIHGIPKGTSGIFTRNGDIPYNRATYGFRMVRKIAYHSTCIISVKLRIFHFESHRGRGAGLQFRNDSHIGARSGRLEIGITKFQIADTARGIASKRRKAHEPICIGFPHIASPRYGVGAAHARFQNLASAHVNGFSLERGCAIIAGTPVTASKFDI